MAVLIALSLPGTRVAAPDEPVRGAVTVRVDDPRLEPPAVALAAPPRRPPRGSRGRPGRAAPGRARPDRRRRRRAARPDGARSCAARPRPTPRGWRTCPCPTCGRASSPSAPPTGPRDPAYVVPAARRGRADRSLAPARAAAERRPGAARPPSSGASGARPGFEGPGRPLRVVEGRPALRWAIDIAAPLAPRGRRWGDDPFARSLAAALERLGQWVTVDHPETRAAGLARPRRRRPGASAASSRSPRPRPTPASPPGCCG